MKVGVYYRNSDVRIEEREIPKISDSEILVKVRASGICGSDVVEWYRMKKAPLVPGHEVSGEIARVGKNVKGYKEGDRVAVIHKVPCNTCQHCLKGNHSSCDTSRSTNFDPGGFSEYIRVPEINVDRGTFPVPNNVSFEEATFFEPLSCAVRAQRKMGIHPGETVLIAGSGIAGLLHIKLAKANGAGKIFASDINDYRLEKARELGAIPIKAMEDIPARIRESNNGFLADKIIVCTGAKSALLQAFKSVERGGTILLFAVPRPDEDVIVPLNDFWTSEIRIMTSYYTSPQDMRSAIKLIESGRVRVDDMITHRLPLDEIQKGFDLVSQGKESIKVIIEPHTSF